MRIEEIEIPESWCKALNELKALDPNAMIAGGAIRDLYLGVTPKDVDFFTTILPNDLKTLAPASDMDYVGMKYVLSVGSVLAPEVPFNYVVIQETHKLDLLSSFDFGICQIGFDGTSILRTSAFDWDRKYSIFTLRHIDRYPRSIKRYARISQRYESWNIAIPELDTLNAKDPL